MDDMKQELLDVQECIQQLLAGDYNSFVTGPTQQELRLEELYSREALLYSALEQAEYE